MEGLLCSEEPEQSPAGGLVPSGGEHSRFVAISEAGPMAPGSRAREPSWSRERFTR